MSFSTSTNDSLHANSSSTTMVASGASSPALGIPSYPAMGTQSSLAVATTPSTANLPVAPGVAAGAAPGVPLSHDIHSVAIKSLVPYTLDL
jgi:hypothetical protein